MIGQSTTIRVPIVDDPLSGKDWQPSYHRDPEMTVIATAENGAGDRFREYQPDVTLMTANAASWWKH